MRNKQTTGGFWARFGNVLRRVHIRALLLGVGIGILLGWAILTLIVMFGQRIDTSSYQMVYLTNGQVIFGKLQNTSGGYLVIKNPYTLQASGQTTNDAPTSIVKMSDQIYGPQDSVAVRSDNIISWQNLRSDSKVSQAIKKRADQ